MEKYTIREAYPYMESHEVSIISKNLYFTELVNLNGCQCNSLKNNDEIRNKCQQIVDLIRDIEKLNIKD